MTREPAIHPITRTVLGADAEREIRAASTRLAAYGTLAPGRPNHHILDPVQPQSWTTGHVRGTLPPDGWGAALGYPALVFDPSADAVPVHILESPALLNDWPRLDEFEGDAYRRTIVPVTRTATPAAGSERIIAASIYLLAGAPP